MNLKGAAISESMCIGFYQRRRTEANVWINPTTFDGHPGFIGSIDPVSGQVTVSQGTSLDLYDHTEDSLFGIDTFLIQVHETMVIPYSASPASGVIQIEEDVKDGFGEYA